MVSGTSASGISGDKTSTKATGFGYEIWILKLDADGNILWQISTGSGSTDAAKGLTATKDGGFAIVANVSGNGGDVSGKPDNYYSDVWVAKFSDVGVLQWQKTFGGSGSEYATSIASTTNDGFFITATSNSTDGDVVGLHKSSIIVSDIWIIKVATTTLPVNFVNIIAHYRTHTNEVDVAWTIAKEQNTNHYAVQLSENAHDFVTVQTMNQTGLSSYHTTIKLDSKYKNNNILYVRVKATDNNGQSFYSTVVPLNINAVNTGQLKIYPNPTTDYLYFSNQSPSKIQITDIFGKIVWVSAADQQTHTINVKHWASGNYFIHCFLPNQQRVSIHQFEKK